MNRIAKRIMGNNHEEELCQQFNDLFKQYLNNNVYKEFIDYELPENIENYKQLRPDIAIHEFINYFLRNSSINDKLEDITKKVIGERSSQTIYNIIQKLEYNYANDPNSAPAGVKSFLEELKK